MVPFLYVNGLGDGKTKLQEKLAMWWWVRSGSQLHHAHIDWYSSDLFDKQLDKVIKQANDLLLKYGKVVIIGSSAGGSLALNAFHSLRDKNVIVINAHGRLREGDYTNLNWYSLHKRAHLDSNQPSYSFYDSVKYCEQKVLPSLKDEDKCRVLIMTQLTDMVVPIPLMRVEGVKEHRSLVLGHSGGFLAHLIASRDLLMRFANEAVVSAD